MSRKKIKHFIKNNIFPVSLRWKLIILFAGAMFISMVLFGSIMFINVYKNTRTSLSKNIAGMVTAVSESMDQSFLVAQNLAMELAASEGVQEWLDDENYYSKENPDYYNRKAVFNRELNRILIYSNAKKLNVVEYAAVFVDDDMIDYADIQSVGEKKIRIGLEKAYKQLIKDKDIYIYSQLVTEPDNAIFHVRKLKSYPNTAKQLVIMVATDEREVYKKYEDLIQNNESIVYLVDNKNKVLSSNKKNKIGSRMDKDLVAGIEENRSEIRLDQNYLVDSEELGESDMRLIFLYPQKLLAMQAFKAVLPYLLLSVIIIIICHFAAVLLGLRSTQFLNEFVLAMKAVKEKNYDIKIRKYKDPEIDRLGEAFNEMTAEIKELIQNKYESQLLLNEMEIRFLQHQMNPHFLFNVLLTIQIKAKRCADETIYNMVSTLSSLLRASIYTNNVEMITVRQELEYAQFYLYLQKMRFDDMIFYDISVEDKSLKDCLIPKFVIEPIVENAVIHGTENIDQPGEIKIILRRDGKNLTADVIDNGAGFDVEEYQRKMREKRKHQDVRQTREKIGLRNVDLRLKHIYGEEYGIKIQSEINKGTVIHITIPLKECETDV